MEEKFAENKYILFQDLWWQKMESGNGSYVWVSFNGNVLPKDFDIESVPQVSANNWQELDWSNTALNNPNLPTGWVDPEGLFTGCEYRLHSFQAICVHKMTERELEAKGYVKITYSNGFKNVKAYFAGVNYDLVPTAEQIKYLKNNTECNVEEFLQTIRVAKAGMTRK